MKKRRILKIKIFKIRIFKIRNIGRFVENQVRMQKESYKIFYKSIFRKIHCVIIYGSLSMLMLVGCGRDVSVLKDGTMEEISHNNSIDDDTAQNQGTQEEQKSEDTSQSKNLIYIDLGGAVEHPGVYALEKGSRVFEVIALAGGFTKEAYVRNINQAEVLTDGQQIYVYTVEEAETLLVNGMLEDTNNMNPSVAGGNSASGKVNINLADKAALMTLTGIGSTRADAILQYRTKHGTFKKIEELMQVEGIKEKTYEKIKDCITVQ